MTNQYCTAMLTGHAEYLGRVGALAAVLDVGIAIASGQGIAVAHADDTPSDTHETTDTQKDNDPSKPAESPQTPDPVVSGGHSSPASILRLDSFARITVRNSGGALAAPVGYGVNTVAITPTGTVTGTLNSAHLEIEMLVVDNQASFTVSGVSAGTDTITYTVSDGTTESTGVITIVVDNPPVAGGSASEDV
jgi:hypothetical protein